MTHGGNVWQAGKPEQWLDFSANLRPEGTPEWAKQAMIAGIENARYYPDPDMKRAGRALAEYLEVDASFVCPAAGGISAIAMANCLETSETLIFTPCFCEYAQFAASPVRKISLLQADRRIALPEKLEIKKNSLVWFCNPMNPVGYAFSRPEILRLLAAVEDAAAYLAIDEAFIEYCPEHTALDLLQKHERLLIVGSMTKIMGIPGVRLGYLCAQPQVLAQLRRHQTTWELNCFAEAIACALPQHRQDICLDSQRNACRREMLVEGLRGLGIYVYPSQSACILACFDRPVDSIAEKLREQKILVRSCMNFDDINDGFHLRLAVKDEQSNQILIDVLREVLLCTGNH